MVKRIKHGVALTDYDRSTFYVYGHHPEGAFLLIFFTFFFTFFFGGVGTDFVRFVCVVGYTDYPVAKELVGLE